MARKHTIWRAKVSGIGEFPIDMLRYDRAHPEYENDSGTVVATFSGRHSRETVTIVGGMSGGPTKDRWSSFLWGVEEWEWID